MSHSAPQRVTTNRFDVRGNTINRVIKQDIIARFVPIGAFGGGPNLKYLIGLWFLHYFGRPFIRLGMRFEKQLALAARWLRRKK